MGMILISYGDAGYAHKGYAAQVLDDDSITGTYSDATIPRMIGQIVAACDCGWTGMIRYPTTTGLFDEDAEQLALIQWEHTHARPTLRRLQLEEFDRLGGRLQVSPGTAPSSRPTHAKVRRPQPALPCSVRYLRTYTGPPSWPASYNTPSGRPSSDQRQAGRLTQAGT